MTDQQEGTRQTRSWLRWVIGGLTALMGLAGLAWTAVIFTAEYRFRVIPPLPARAAERQTLTEYAIELEKLLKLDPTNGEIRNLYASLLGKWGDYDKAIENLQIARQTQNNQDSLYFLADMYEKKEEINKAEATMTQCLRINPGDRLFNPARLRLLNQRVKQMRDQKTKGVKIDEKVYAEARRAYGEAALNWAIRAPHDKNSYFFLGNFYIDPLYPLQAYRCFLIGLSQARWLNLNEQVMIPPQGVLNTIRQIINGRYAKPYRDLP